MHQCRQIFTLSLCLILYSIVSGDAQPHYAFTDLGTFQPNAIAGPWVVGVENGLPTRLNLDTGQKITLGHQGQGGTVYAVIATGEAVGTITIPGASGPTDAATFWDATGIAYGLPGPLPSYARDLNHHWTVAGYSPSCVGGTRAMRWWPTEGRAECLEARGPAGYSVGNAIDGQHRVWGNVSNVVAVWEVGQRGYLLSQEGGAQAIVRGANEVIAVGNAENIGGIGNANFAQLAAHYRFPPAITLLPAPGPITYQTSCSALGINTALVTVGVCDERAMLWPDTTTVVDLNTRVQAGVILESARGINDDGEIIGRTQAGRGFLLTPVAAPMAQCGGSMPCRCGDTVIADYTFTSHLSCDLHGFDAALVIADGVTVYGNNFFLMGTGYGTGVLFDGTHQGHVTALHVTGFDTGVKMRAGAYGNFYHGGWTWGHRQHGLMLEQGAQGNWVWNVYSLLNGASGMHLEDVSGNILAYNISSSNPISLHMVRADQNTIWLNGWYGDRGHAVVLDESHGNSFYWNDVACWGGGAVILHNSLDNIAHENNVRCPVFTDQAVASR